MNGKIINSQTSRHHRKAQPTKTTAKSAENISAIKLLLKIKTYKMTFPAISCQVVSRKSSVL